MAIEFFLDRFHDTKDAEALIWRDRPVLYGDLTELVEFWQEHLVKEGVPKGAIIALEADFSPNSVALLLSLLQHTCVVGLLTAEMKSSWAELLSVAEVEWIITIELKGFKPHTHPPFGLVQSRMGETTPHATSRHPRRQMLHLGKPQDPYGFGSYFTWGLPK